MSNLREIIRHQAAYRPTVGDWETAQDYPLVPGAIYSCYNNPNRICSIIIEAVTSDTVTLRNTRVGCGAITISHRAAYEILENYTVEPLGDIHCGSLPT